jgi:hypothetical protein
MWADLITYALAFLSGFVLGVVGLAILVMGGQCSREEERRDEAQRLAGKEG